MLLQRLNLHPSYQEFGFPEIDVAAARAVGKKVLDGGTRVGCRLLLLDGTHFTHLLQPFDGQKTPQRPTAYKQEPLDSLI